MDKSEPNAAAGAVQGVPTRPRDPWDAEQELFFETLAELRLG